KGRRRVGRRRHRSRARGLTLNGCSRPRGANDAALPHRVCKSPLGTHHGEDIMTMELEWTKRVEAWRNSGLSAAQFCNGKDFSASGLRYWMSRLRKEQRQNGVKDDARVARVARALANADPDTSIVIEVGQARVGIRRGFDRETLRGLLELLDRVGGAEND